MNLIYKLFIICLGLCLLPLIFLVAGMIFLFTGIPLFYVQKRVGKQGKIFQLIKFRTMIQEADGLKYKFRTLNEAHSPVFKIHHDPRFTRIGKFLSHTGLDELPQLLNILKGEMALIGPRPLPVEEAAKLKEWQQDRHTVKPGVISPWVVDGYHKRSFDEWMKSDIEYSQKKNVLFDISLMGKAAVFFIRQLSIEIKENLTVLSNKLRKK